MRLVMVGAIGSVLSLFFLINRTEAIAVSRLKVSSTSFSENEPIPPKFTADGADVSPQLSWSGAPGGVKEFAIICDDPDAPTSEPWVHWVLYHIPADVKSLPEGAAKGERFSGAEGAMQGINSWKTIGYRGPQPPPGKVHHYHFQVYALDAAPTVGPNVDKNSLLKQIRSHILASGETIGTYRH